MIVLDAGGDQTQKLKQINDEAEPLRPLIDAAADNRVLVFKDGMATEYGFRDFYDLGDTEARDAIRPRGNLVLLPQGVGPFAQKVLAINERKPRVGIAVIHELLSTEGDYEPYTMAGVRKALEAQGFEVTDIVLKNWGGGGRRRPPRTRPRRADSKRFWARSKELDAAIPKLQAAHHDGQVLLDKVRTGTLDELTRVFRAELGGRPFTEAMRKNVTEDIGSQVETLGYIIKQNVEARQELETDRPQLEGDERLVEGRRMTDLKAKTAKLLADCDLLIVPRLTLRNLTALPEAEYIPAQLYRLDAVQTEAIKDFIKAGKPVLACFGPNNEDPENRARPAADGDRQPRRLVRPARHPLRQADDPVRGRRPGVRRTAGQRLRLRAEGQAAAGAIPGAGRRPRRAGRSA